MLSKFSCVTCQPRTLRETKNLFCTFLWMGNSTMRKLFIDRLSSPGLYPSTATLPSCTLCNFLPFPLRSKLSFPLQTSVLVSRISSSQRLNSVLPYLSLPLLSHSIFLPPSHQNSLTVRTPPSKICSVFSACLSCLDILLEEVEAE